MNEHVKQAQDFLAETTTTMKILFLGSDINKEWGDNVPRNKYRVVLGNRRGNIDFPFWDSIRNKEQGKKPTSYDVLACLQTYDVGSFENFCAEFGYDEDSRKAERTYHAVQEEYAKLCSIFTEEELEKLGEI